MNQIILESKLVPVVVFHSLEEVEPTLKLLEEHGIKVIEICFRTECALRALTLAVSTFPDLCIGAGTVINKTQAVQAITVGAQFIVSPGLSKEVAEACQTNKIDYIPGVVTPTEIITALDLGLTYLKFFPAGVFGGLKAIKALSAAFPQVKFLPTGGVDNTNLAEFLTEKSVFAIGGSWLLKGDIAATCDEAIRIVKESENK